MLNISNLLLITKLKPEYSRNCRIFIIINLLQSTNNRENVGYFYILVYYRALILKKMLTISNLWFITEPKHSAISIHGDTGVPRSAVFTQEQNHPPGHSHQELCVSGQICTDFRTQ